MRIHTLLLAAGIAILAACNKTPDLDYASFVNQKIGTGGHGHVFMGANVPFGFVQLVGPSWTKPKGNISNKIHAS